jgi:hypothetical protein
VFVNDYAKLKSNILSPSFKWHGHIDKFFNIVCTTGYPFFEWNGKVYKVENDQINYSDTGLKIDDFE